MSRSFPITLPLLHALSSRSGIKHMAEVVLRKTKYLDFSTQMSSVHSAASTMIIRRNAAEFHIIAPLTMVIPTSKAKLMRFARKSIAASKTWLEKHTTQAGGPCAQNVASLTMMYFSNPVKA